MDLYSIFNNGWYRIELLFENPFFCFKTISQTIPKIRYSKVTNFQETKWPTLFPHIKLIWGRIEENNDSSTVTITIRKARRNEILKINLSTISRKWYRDKTESILNRTFLFLIVEDFWKILCKNLWDYQDFKVLVKF